MVSVETVGSIFVKVFKLVLNVIVLVLYSTGYGGDFLGVGGTWNLNEEKNADAEIFASGIIVGYLIYNSVQLVAYLFGTTKHKRQLSDTIMNVVGVILWLAVGGIAIHYWHGYMSDHDFVHVVSERAVGLAVGALSIIIGALYLVDTVLAFIHYSKYENNKY